jgi:hypothetical protein
MSAIVENLPLELANLVYSYLGKSETAVIMEEYINRDENEFCNTCNQYVADKDKLGKCIYAGGVCEYCHAEELGVDVYTCCDCGDKTYTYGKFNNMEEHGLYCDSCLDGFDACYMCGETDWHGECVEDENGTICVECNESMN